jgi:hypothetical protein
LKCLHLWDNDVFSLWDYFVLHILDNYVINHNSGTALHLYVTRLLFIPSFISHPSEMLEASPFEAGLHAHRSKRHNENNQRLY